MIKIKNLYFNYEEISALKNINIEIKKNKITCLIGPNGAGKTTLLKIISGYLPYKNGEVTLDGRTLKNYSHKELAKIRAYVPQSLQIDFPFNCEEIVMMGRFPHLNYLGYETRKDKEIVASAMEKTKTLHLKYRPINRVSGGEFQRVIIAQTLAQESNLLILDEPTSHLDFNFQMEIMDIIEELNKTKNLTVILALHDINLAAIYSHNLVLINAGGIFCEGLPAEVITSKNIEEVYKRKVSIQPANDRKIPQIILSSSKTTG